MQKNSLIKKMENELNRIYYMHDSPEVQKFSPRKEKFSISKRPCNIQGNWLSKL